MKSQQAPKEAFLELANDIPEVSALKAMTVNQLVDKYQEVFGEPTRSRNRQHLLRCVSWRIQELAFGGLSSATVARLAVVSAEAPRPWRRRLMLQGADSSPRLAVTPAPVQQKPTVRDPRLPPVGTVLRRTYRSSIHEVLVLHDDFEYHGKRYASLSRIAREITGTTWNGFGFFKIPSSAEEAAE